MKLLVSTTTGWNPGDDFIRMGCLALMEHALGVEMQCAFYDRNELVARSPLDKARRDANRWVPNSQSKFDAILIAGSPDWGKSNQPLYLTQPQTPLIALGLGGDSPEHLKTHTTEWTIRALRSALLVTTRDELTHEWLHSLGVKNFLLPCPAAWAVAHGKVPPAMRPGAVVGCREAWPATLHSLQATRYDLVVHLLHEWQQAATEGIEAQYDAEPSRLLALLLRYDRLICGRLHAAIPMLGAGRPVQMLPGLCERVQRGWSVLSKFGAGQTPHGWTEWGHDCVCQWFQDSSARVREAFGK